MSSLNWAKASEKARVALERAQGDPDRSRLSLLTFRKQALKGMPRTAQLGKCSECGGQMKLRNGSRGVFAGCSNYPACHHTESVHKGR